MSAFFFVGKDLAEIALPPQSLLVERGWRSDRRIDSDQSLGMPDETVNLLKLDDTSFTKLYASNIQPVLAGNEVGRQAAMKTYTFRRNLGLAGAAAVGIATYAIWGDVLNALIFGGMAFAGAHYYAYQPLAVVETATKSQSLSAIAKAIGCQFQLGAFAPQALDNFKELKLLPSCDRSSYTDCFAGAYEGCAFTFYEGHLEDRVQTKNGSRWVTVFRGQLIRIAFPKKFHGTTVVRRDAGLFNFVQRWATELQRVGLGDSRLEKAFEVYSNDQVEARYLIHPVFMERLLALETQFKGKRLRCAFTEGDLLIAVEGGDKFEIGSMFSKLDDIERARAIVKDIAEIMRVIDAVLTAEQGALPTS
jgi:hypothetical protein